MTTLDNCPHCGVSLLGAPIPQASRDAGYYGAATHFRREVGNEVPWDFDGVLFWECPDCGGTWQRFDLTSPRHHVAEKYMQGAQRIANMHARGGQIVDPETGEDHEHT